MFDLNGWWGYYPRKLSLTISINSSISESITLGKYFTFEGKGTDKVLAEDIGTLPTPSATYIEEADGNWYTEDFTAYAPADVPNLTEMTYYASKKIANGVIDARVLNYKGLKYVLQSLNTVIDAGLETHTHSWNDLENKPFEEIDVDVFFALELDANTSIEDQWDSVVEQGFSHTQTNMATYVFKKNIGTYGVEGLIGAKAIFTDFGGGTTKEIIVSEDMISSDKLTISEQDASLILSEDGDLEVIVQASASSWRPMHTFTSLGFTEIKTLDPKYLPENIQSDWNQTDETALDFIKNKPVEETEDDAMEMLFDMGIIIPAVDDGAILTDENGNILVI